MSEDKSEYNQQKKKRFKISYYFRVDLKTIQGKITGAFLLVALIATIMLYVNTRTWKSVNNSYTFVIENVYPSKDMLSKIRGSVSGTNSLAMQYFNSSNDALNESRLRIWKNTIMPCADTLKQKSEHWDGQHIHTYLAEFLSAIPELRTMQNQAVESNDERKLNASDYEEKVESIFFLISQIGDELDKMQNESLGRSDAIKDNMNLILFIQYLFAFLLSTAIASAILINVLKKIKFLKEKIREMAKGDLPETIPPTTDEMNTIIAALNELADNLRSITDFSSEVGKGQFDSNITVFNNQGDLGQALAQMRESLKEVAAEDKKRVWFNEGIARFGDIQRANNNDMDALADAMMSELVGYLGINQGSIFIVNTEDPKNIILQLKATYAYDRRKYEQKELRPGQSLVGQCYLERDIIHLTEIPESYINIRSGLGDASPTNLLIVPMMVNEEVVGVLELASFHPFEEHHINFVKRVAENLAASIQTVQINQETNRLLEESQMRAEQMQAQEEEMRQNMEEMQATQEEMSRLKNQSDYIFDNFDGVVFICANDAQFTMEFMSSGMEELSGYSAEDFVSGRKHLPDLFTERTRKDQVKLIDEPMQIAFDTKSYYRVEYSIKHKNGNEIIVVEKGRAVYDDHGEVLKIVGFITRM